MLSRPRSAGFSRVWVRGVAPGCSLLRLVAATGKKLEGASMKREISSSQREIQEAETVPWAGCVALCRVISYGSAGSLGTVALAEVSLVRRVDLGRTNRLRKVSSGTWDFEQVFHLVSACFTWFQLSGEKNWNGDAEKWRFLATRNVSLTRALRGLSRFSVSPCFTWLHLHHAKTR